MDRKRVEAMSLEELEALANRKDRLVSTLIEALCLACKGKSDVEILDIVHDVRDRLLDAMTDDGTYEALKARRREALKAEGKAQRQANAT